MRDFEVWVSNISPFSGATFGRLLAPDFTLCRSHAGPAGPGERVTMMCRHPLAYGRYVYVSLPPGTGEFTTALTLCEVEVYQHSGEMSANRLLKLQLFCKMEMCRYVYMNNLPLCLYAYQVVFPVMMEILIFSIGNTYLY